MHRSLPVTRAEGMTHQPKDSVKPLGVVWVDCTRSVVNSGLVRVLEGQARVRQGPKPPGEVPACVILCVNHDEDLSERVQFYKRSSPDTPPVVVFGPQLDLPLARDALRAGASGFVHAGMTPDQLVRAVTVAARGELVAPRELLEYMLTEDESADLTSLTVRQREILGYVVEGLSNAQIGKRLFLSESTIKQHLRSAYKVLGVKNRTEAANLFRRGS